MNRLQLRYFLSLRLESERKHSSKNSVRHEFYRQFMQLLDDQIQPVLKDARARLGDSRGRSSAFIPYRFSRDSTSTLFRELEKDLMPKAKPKDQKKWQEFYAMVKDLLDNAEMTVQARRSSKTVAPPTNVVPVEPDSSGDDFEYIARHQRFAFLETHQVKVIRPKPIRAVPPVAVGLSKERKSTQFLGNPVCGDPGAAVSSHALPVRQTFSK